MSEWLHDPFRSPNAETRLICLPYAGGHAGIFSGWAEELSDVDVCAVQLPGRASRFSEPPIDNLTELVAHLVPAVAGLADRPIAIFGHSMGASVGFELIRALPSSAAKMVKRLIVSARMAPTFDVKDPPIHDLPKADFISALSGLEGTQPEFFENDELVDLLLPMLRADFRLIGTYKPQTIQPIDVPISALAGSRDSRAPADSMADWASLSRSGFDQTIIDGGHFFIDTAKADVLRTLAQRLSA